MGIYHIFLYTGIAGIVLTLILTLIRRPENAILDILKNWMGSLFIFSGVVKAIDPLGTAYKISEYFEVLHLTFLEPFCTELSVAMIVLEIVLGVAMIIGWQSRLTYIVTFLLLIFFTFLTGFTYLSGWDLKTLTFDATKMKVTSCGCFGDFIKLEPRLSFIKDLILIVAGLVLIIFSKRIKDVFKNKWIGNGIVIVSTVFTLWFCLRNYVWNEPIVDFRPYKIGVNNKEDRTPKKPPVLEMQFVYKNKKSGKSESFGLKNLPADLADNWEFVERKDKVLDPGIPAKILDFMIQHQGEDITEDILNNPDYSFAVVAYDIHKTKTSAIKDKINPFMEKARLAGYDVFGVSQNADSSFLKANAIKYPFYFGDAVFLKTIGRGNPVILELRDGVIMNKWHWAKFPSWEEVAKDLNSNP